MVVASNQLKPTVCFLAYRFSCVLSRQGWEKRHLASIPKGQFDKITGMIQMCHHTIACTC